MSRGVRCGIVSIPTVRSIAADDEQRVHPDPGGRVVVDVHVGADPGVADRGRDLDQARVVGPQRRIDLDRGDEPFLTEVGGEAGLDHLVLDRRGQLALGDLERRAGRALLVERVPDRADLGGRRTATAADHHRAQLPRMGGELGEVLRRGVRVDHPPAGHAGEPDVGQSCERHVPSLHRLEGIERRRRPGAVVRPDRRDAQARQTLGRLGRADAADRLGVLSEGHHRDDRQV